MLKKIIVPILLTLLLIEAILWIGFRQGSAPKIDIKMTQDIPGLSEEVHFQKNQLGLRTNSIQQKKKKDGVYRIIILGASTAEQATQSNEDTWGLQLEENLKKQLPEKEIEVGIYATGGIKTHEILKWASSHLIELQPDLVITLFGINNLSTDMMYINGGLDKSLMVHLDEKNSPLQFLTKYSQIARYITNIKNNAARLKYTRENNGANFDVAGLSHLRATYISTPQETAPEKFPTSLIADQTRWLLGFLNKHNIPSLTLTQPSLYKAELDYNQEENAFTFKIPPKTKDAYEKMIAEISSLWFLINDGEELIRYQPSEMRRCLDDSNAVQIKVAQEYERHSFPLHQHLEPNAENFFDDCHFTDLGSERVASLITPSVIEIITGK